MSTHDLVVMGIEVMAEEDRPRHFRDLLLLVQDCSDTEAGGLREVLRMLRDAADSAADLHRGEASAVANDLDTFSAAISEALLA